MGTVEQRDFAYRNQSSLEEGEIAIVSAENQIGALLRRELMNRGSLPPCSVVRPGNVRSGRGSSLRAIVYLPSSDGGLEPNLAEAESFCRSCDVLQSCLLILISSAAIYGASFRNPGLIRECSPIPDGDVLPSNWRALESLVQKLWSAKGPVVILRCATLPSFAQLSPLQAIFSSRWAAAPAGYDPPIQVLSAADLAQAIACALQAGGSRILNVAPDEAIPLRAGLRKAGIKRIPVPWTVLRLACAAGSNFRAGRLDYMRYSWTVSNTALRRIGFRPRHSSAEALEEARPDQFVAAKGKPQPAFDNFGMQKSYIDFFGRTLFKFLADWYWRIEVAGMEHIPASGRGMLVGTHRGFMPWDGVMALHLIVTKTGRYPRFLIHPGLIKFPFLANFMTKLGGIIACQENATYVLEREQLLGVFPEGIHGAFVKYTQAYRIQHFHRDAFVKIALRNRTPIIPFVSVGSAEIFPILAHIRSRAWTRYSEWPAIPITPTFPLLPLPLPSKWHTRFLEPWHIEHDYGPEDAVNPKVVRSISTEIRRRMQAAIDLMLGRRRSVFYGSIFSPSAL